MTKNLGHAVIVGAGIGGLTAAIALADAGWRITLLERAAALLAVGAGLQMSPNATRVLARLGLLEAVGARAMAPTALCIRRGRDSVLLARMPFGKSAERRWNGPTYVIHRADLQSILLDAVAVRPAITLHLNTSLERFEKSGGNADLLIGADGLRSEVRARILGGKADPLVAAHRTAWRALIPAAGVPPPFHAPETNLWLAPKSHLVHYPLRGGGVVNVVAIVEAPKVVAGQGDSGWNAPGDPRIVNRHFAGWTPDVRALIAAAPDWRVWPLHDRQPLMRWSKGSSALLGDAAHPMLPFLAQGASQAIEDAAALAAVLGEGVSDVPSALHRYEAIRARRAATVQNQSRRQGRIYHVSGLAAVARDLAIRTIGPDRLMARYDWVYGHKA